jgi:hypothetical protein
LCPRTFVSGDEPEVGFFYTFIGADATADSNAVVA